MRYYHYRHQSFGTVLAMTLCVGLVCFAGCKDSSQTSASEGSEESAAVETNDNPNGTGAPATIAAESSSASNEPEPEPVKPTIPTVQLTESLDKTCLIKVGDTMPEMALAKLDGQAATLRALAGEKLTVVCFWKADHPYSLEELRQLQTFIVEPYASQGVQVVAINEDDPANVAGDAFRETKATYPCLLDPGGNFFAKVATQDLPRTYLLTPEGKVLWFDISYSRSTLRDLEQAIRFVLEQK